MLIEADELLSQEPGHAAELTSTLDGNLFLGLLVAYPFARFATGGISVVFLFLVFLLVLRVALRVSALRFMVCFIPLAIGTTAGSLTTLVQGQFEEAIYFLFLTIYLVAIAIFLNARFVYSHRVLRWIYALFLVSVFIFYLFPALENLGSEKYLLATVIRKELDYFDDAAQNVASLFESRFRAYFIHANEFGIFAGALLFLLVQSQDASESPVAKAFDFSVAVLLVLLVGQSGSVTGSLLVLIALALRYLPARVVIVATFVIFAFLFFSQIFFPYAMADWLEVGSFYWRYVMAGDILDRTEFGVFAPADISSLGNWPHSIFLDFNYLFGIGGPIAIFCMVSVFSLLAVPPVTKAGILGFFICAALQPAGAMPACFLLLAIAIFATREPERPGNR